MGLFAVWVEGGWDNKEGGIMEEDQYILGENVTHLFKSKKADQFHTESPPPRLHWEDECPWVAFRGVDNNQPCLGCVPRHGPWMRSVDREEETMGKIAADIVNALLVDLRGRRGLGEEWSHIDEEIQIEIKEEWHSIIRDILQEHFND